MSLYHFYQAMPETKVLNITLEMMAQDFLQGKGEYFFTNLPVRGVFPLEKKLSVPAYYFRQKSHRGPSKRSAKSYVAAQK